MKYWNSHTLLFNVQSGTITLENWKIFLIKLNIQKSYDSKSHSKRNENINICPNNWTQMSIAGLFKITPN